MADYADTRARLLEEGALWEDEDFPAEQSSLAFSEKTSWAGIEWKRPKEFCEDPQFMTDGCSRFDLSQGILGNCWFVSGAVTLATRPSLLRKVCPKGQTFEDGQYAGIFRFRFWRFGRWEHVVIDDRLPTRNGRLVFCSNRATPNELWPALLEKAYAKIHKSYQALETGYAHDALVDFTGGIGEFIDLAKDYENRGRLFRVLRNSMRMRSMMCASINVEEGGSYEDKKENGLVTGHAYSLTSIVNVKVGEVRHRLLRLRNPWGHREWNGAWADGSAEWDTITEEDKNKCDLRTVDDGEFWISYEDFLINFHTIQICHLGPDSALEKKEVLWHSASYDGAWVRGVSAGGCGAPPKQAQYWQNPQYVVRLETPDEDGDEECTLVVSLIQKYRRQLKTIRSSTQDFEEPIGFDILKLKDDGSDELGEARLDPEEVRMERKMWRYEQLRERSGRYSLSPGAYCIIPCTFSPDTEAEFLLRLATEQPASSSEVGGSSAMATDMPPKKPASVRKFGEMFAKHAGEDEVVDARELKKMLNQGLKRENEEPFDKETARALITMELGKRGTMDKDQCKKVWREVKRLQNLFDEFDQDGNLVLDKKEMRKAFNSLGFKLTKKILVQIAQHFCGKNESLTLDDFVLLATKLGIQYEKYSRLTRRDPSKVDMTLDEWLESTILS